VGLNILRDKQDEITRCTRFSLSASVSFCFIWILYGYRCKNLTDADKEKRVTSVNDSVMCLKMTKTFFCPKIGLQGEYLLLICPRHFWGNYSCKRSSIGSPFMSYNRKDIRYKMDFLLNKIWVRNFWVALYKTNAASMLNQRVISL
jgi:hypothetical protein